MRTKQIQNNMCDTDFIACYDLAQYLEDDYKWYVQNKDEFLIRIDQLDREPSEVQDEEIQKFIYEDDMISWIHWEDFQREIYYYFRGHIGRQVHVKGSNMTWRNLEGQKTFTLEDEMDIFHEIVPQTDLTFYLYKEDEDNYQAVITHHDSPMGETYNIKITDYGE